MLGFDWRHFLFNAVTMIGVMAVAVLPPLVLLWTLDNYAANQSRAAIDNVAVRLVDHVDTVLNEGADALASLAPYIRETCADEVEQRLREIVAQATYVRYITAVDPSGQTLCASSETAKGLRNAVAFRSARFKSIGLALSSADKKQPAFLQMRWQEGMNSLYAFIVPGVLRADLLPSEWREDASGAVMLDDDTALSSLRQDNKPSRTNAMNALTTTIQSQRFPIKVHLAVPEDVVMAPYVAVAMLIKAGGGMLAIVLIVFVIQSLRRRPQVQDALAWGIKNKEFVPFFQPVMNIQTGGLIGCEVLIRWRKRDGTMIPPGAFIQKAEESGLAVEMTRQLMRKAREELGRHYAERQDLKMAFNLFADHFSDLSTVDDVREIFKTGGIRYSQLVFEVTERYPLPNINRALTAIAAMQSLGCRVALDDAGTGHGGLAYLQKLGMDQVKIDKLFVDTITEGVTASPIIDSLIEMARQMNMEVVAEGVETLTQLEYLKSRGVVAAQGYLFAEPMPAAAYRQLVESMCPVVSADSKLDTSNVVFLDVA